LRKKRSGIDSRSAVGAEMDDVHGAIAAEEA